MLRRQKADGIVTVNGRELGTATVRLVEVYDSIDVRPFSEAKDVAHSSRILGVIEFHGRVAMEQLIGHELHLTTNDHHRLTFQISDAIGSIEAARDFKDLDS